MANDLVPYSQALSDPATTASSLESTDVIAIAREDSDRPTGFKSMVTRLLTLAKKIVSGIDYSTELTETTAKTITGAINEVAQNSGSVDITTAIDTPASVQTFPDGGDNIPMKSLVTEIVPIQEGTGTPSPTNVRNISGVSSVTITDKDDLTTPTETRTVTVSLGQTIYGGYLDVTSGLLTITSKYIELDGSNDEDWSIVANTNKFYCAYPDIAEIYIGGDYSNLYDFGGQASSSSSVVDDKTFYTQRNQNQPQYNRFWVYDSSYSTVEDLRLALASTPMQIVCPLREDNYITVQLPPNTLNTLSGLNNIYSDCGDIQSLEYFNENGDDIASLVELESGKQIDLVATLVAGQTSLTFTNSQIKADSTIDVYTDTFGVNPTNIVVSLGQVVLTFASRTSDLQVKVRIS